MDQPPRPVLVLGHHRSGTTWVSTVLGAASGYVALPGELSNPTSGYRLGGQDLPPYVTAPQLDRDRTDAALARLTRRPHRSLFSRRRPAGWLAPRRWRDTPVFKDPLGARIATYLATALDARAAVVVRHPGAIWVSLRRVGWDSSVPDLGVGGGELDSFARLWSVVYAELTGAADEGGWPVVRHEDLALQPHEGFAALSGRLGVPNDQAMQEEVQRTTGGARATPAGDVVHQLERDSASVVDAWRDRISAYELARIEAGTADVAGQWY